MGAPRLEIDLNKIHHNAHELVTRLVARGISVTGVTKAALGSSRIANTLLKAGVLGLGDSRIENIKAMRISAHKVFIQDAFMILIRSPMLSQIEQVIKYADASCNTEISVIKQLSIEAKKQGRVHQVILMIELGDLREGIMPSDVISTVRDVLKLPNIILKGIGTNLACRSGVSPDCNNMGALSELAKRIEGVFNITLEQVSGGNSANIQWVLNDNNDTGRVNNLRLGEAILLGCEPLERRVIDGLHTNAIRLVAEVIESKLKPSKPTGNIAQSAFGQVDKHVTDRGLVSQAILAVGLQDIDSKGLTPSEGIYIMGGSSDHLIVESVNDNLSVGDEVSFDLDYSALLRAMTSPFIIKKYSV